MNHWPVSQPEALLRDDSRVTVLGFADIAAAMQATALAAQQATVEVGLACQR